MQRFLQYHVPMRFFRKPTKLQDFALPDYGLVYLNHLKGEFAGLCPSKNQTNDEYNPYEVAKNVITKAEQGQNLTWGDLYALEKAILDLQPIEVVRERGWSIEARYRDAAGVSAAFDSWLKQNPVTDEAAVRARTENLVRELYRLYTVNSCREALRARLSRFTSLLVLTAGMVTVAVTVYKPSALWTVFLVAYAGAVGGFVSFQRRVQSLPNHGESLSDLAELAGGTGIYLSPITGAIFAIVLSMLFTAKLMEGSLFPKIATLLDKSNVGWTFSTFGGQTGPETGVDWAKLLIWSFIAGFAERFVPDTLDRLIARQEVDKK